MSELDPDVMDQFYMKDGVTAKDVPRVSGICDHHDARFCQIRGNLLTIHVTPEPESSCGSFEINFSLNSYNDPIRKVVGIFKPGKFVTTVCNSEFACLLQKIEGFKGLDCQSAMFSDYDFVFTGFATNQ
ncbi:hypothetical protein HPG69_015446 [Diceros bicornis minor]|uniref:Uncharacterized protein n=1 Tax=Diceros bicornis minor TaxID=77932 RepID=A0A7J7F2U7_DICBM|nr:hypothetical protein HPG69_015446 [Diceros bicornis minor]